MVRSQPWESHGVLDEVDCRAPPLCALGAELASHGLAVGRIGHRRVDEENGNYPGIFQDVGRSPTGNPAPVPRAV